MLHKKFQIDGHIRYVKSSEQAVWSWIYPIPQGIYQLFVKGQKSHLIQEKIDQLNELGMERAFLVVASKPHAHKTWNERFEDLKEYS